MFLDQSITPLVSIACITYNQSEYVCQAINGFLMQKVNFPIEIIIHDDASTDGTAEIIREYEIKYPNIIKALYQTENQYIKGKGILAPFVYPVCSGKYIALCEGDDYWTDPLKLQKQVDFLEKNEEYGLVYSEFDSFYQSSKKIEKDCFRNNLGLHPNTFEDFLINAWFLAPVTWVFRTTFLNQIKSLQKENYVVGDLPILLTISKNSKIVFLDESTAVYRILQNSASHFNDSSKQFEFQRGIFKIQMDFAKNNNAQQSIIIKIKNKYYKNIFTSACLLNKIELKNEAYLYIKNNIMLTKKHKLIFFMTKFKFIRYILNIYFKL
jgi:glycosyltransferase involved in cell wall biosynthesis